MSPTVRLVIVTLSLVLATLTAAGCHRTPRESVVLYASADDVVARRIVAAFEAANPDLDVKMVGDLEAQKTTGLARRLRDEAPKPVADVFWSSEVFMMIRLADDGLLEPHVSPVVADWPKAFRDPEHRWHGFAARARVIVYATDRVDAADAPKTWMHLTRDRWRGRVVMADPRFGTTRGHLGAMKAYWDRHAMPGFYDAWLDGLARNEVRLLPGGNAAVVDAVARGEADLGMTDTDDVWAAQANGLKVALVYPDHGIDPRDPGGGTLLIPNTVARVKGGPNPEGGARLVDFLLSAEVERMLAESTARNVALRPDVAAAHPDTVVPRPLDVAFAIAAAMMDDAVDAAMRTLQP